MGPSAAVGPWGGSGGFSWDDGTYECIRKIVIYSGSCIDSISVEYDKNGEPKAGGKHGGNGGNRAEIKLDCPHQYIVSVSGHYGPVPIAPGPVVRSLKFVINDGTVFGPYGNEEGTPFTLPIEEGRITGFTGRSAMLLDAIGFRLSPDN